jgi:hypothetical protein
MEVMNYLCCINACFSESFILVSCLKEVQQIKSTMKKIIDYLLEALKAKPVLKRSYCEIEERELPRMPVKQKTSVK